MILVLGPAAQTPYGSLRHDARAGGLLVFPWGALTLTMLAPNRLGDRSVPDLCIVVVVVVVVVVGCAQVLERVLLPRSWGQPTHQATVVARDTGVERGQGHPTFFFSFSTTQKTSYERSSWEIFGNFRENLHILGHTADVTARE